MSREKKMNEICEGGFLSVAEAARLLHFSTSKVYKMLRKRELKGKQMGGRSWRVSMKALKEFVDGK